MFSLNRSTFFVSFVFFLLTVYAGAQEPISVLPNELPGSINQGQELRSASISEANNFKSLNASVSSGSSTESCMVMDSNGRLVAGSCPSSSKGPEHPFKHTIPLTNHNMVANALDDNHAAMQHFSKYLTTKVGVAISTQAFSQPVAAEIMNAAVSYAQNDAILCQQTHLQFVADLKSSEGGDSELDAYLGCIRELIKGTNGSASAPPCQAIAACQNDDYLSHEARGKGTSTLPEDYFSSQYESAWKPIHNECHPDNPRLQWVSPYHNDPPELRMSRLLFTDMLFCEYHQPGFCTPQRADFKVPNQTPQDLQCATGLLYEEFMRQYLGNFALMRPKSGQSGLNQGIFSMEWQGVNPQKAKWPPEVGIEISGNDFYPLYEAGTTFTNLMQFMHNVCRFHNAVGGVSTEHSPLQRPVDQGDDATLEIANGPSSTETVQLKELQSRGYCNSQQSVINSHRAMLGVGDFPFLEGTCDAMWYATKAQFVQNNYTCEDLRGCIDKRVPGSGDCQWEYAKIIENPEGSPEWARLLASYATVIGQLKWRDALKRLNAHIGTMSRGKSNWYAAKAAELISKHLTDELNSNIDIRMKELREDIEKMIEMKNKNRTGVLSYSNSGEGSNNNQTGTGGLAT
jgi:hypothetical protein